MKSNEIIISIILLIAIIISFNFLWTNLISLQPLQNVNITNSSEFPPSAGVQFYPNMRYPTNNISFSIANICDQKRTEEALTAFGILENQTIIRFYQVQQNAEIQVLCSNISSNSEDSSHFIAGEGGPTSILSDGQYYIIYYGAVSLYQTDNCSTPTIALHEILHSLGFDHNNTDPNSIMYPITSCHKTLDQYIINEINSLYSIPSEPDLMIINATVNRNGSYISFGVNIANYGFRDIQDTDLTLYDQNTELNTFDIGGLNVGTIKRFNGNNIMIPANTTRITFFVTSTANESEISIINNQLTLNI